MANYAIIKAGGGQYRVAEGDTLKLQKLEGEPGTEVTFPSVLLVSREGEVSVGRPFVPGAKVVAEITGQIKAKKIRIFTFRRKRGQQHTQGHRQKLTSVRIKSIVGA